MPKPYIPIYKQGEEVAHDVKAKMLAALLVQPQMSLKKAAQEMGMTTRQARELSNSQVCKEALIRLGDEAVKSAKSEIKAKTALLVDAAMKTLEYHLNKKNLNAIGPVLKILGISDQEPQTGDTQINIVMPTGVTPTEEPKIIPAEYAEIGAENSDETKT